MSLFESFRRPSAREIAELQQREAGLHDTVDLLSRRAEYLQARRETLRADLSEQASLAIDEELLRAELDRATARSKRRGGLRALEAEAIAAEARLAAFKGEAPPAMPIKYGESDEAAARQEIDTLEFAHRDILEKLTAIRSRIAEKDRELRERFGIPPDETPTA
jgi:chromosome segregation ATPase